MLKQERHQFILKNLKLNRKVLSTHLSSELQVSEDTIRRDLKELESKNLLYKVHGGALTIQDKILTYNERSVSDLEKKSVIAKKAVSLIRNGQVIIMSGSTANLALAKIIPHDISATIFTYSLPIALELTYHPLIEIIFIGGKLNKTAQVTTGIDVTNSISGIRVDICFMGVGGIDTNRGLTEANWEVAHIKKSMILASDHVVALSLSKRINQVKRYSAISINHIDTLITETNSGEDIFIDFKDKGITIL